MRIFHGRELIQNDYPRNKKHEVILEDDESFLEQSDQQEEIWCGIKTEEAKNIADFINKAQILGIENKSVNAAYEFRGILKKVWG